MIQRNSVVYLETSGLNHLFDNLSIDDAKATKAHHLMKGTIFYISPMTVWEILMTNNKERRESLLYFAQYLCHNRLICSPTELLVNYINTGCPINETRYDFHSKLEISRVWTDICADTSKTFILDHNDLVNRTLSIQNLFTDTIKKINGLFSVIGSMSYDNTNHVLEAILSRDSQYFQFEESERKRKKIALLLMFLLLGSGIDIDSSAINSFWNSKISFDSTEERIKYIVNNYLVLLDRGPIASMAMFAMIQLNKRHRINRGILIDLLHSIYIFYTDIFLTNDKHFKSLKEENEYTVYSRILYLGESIIVDAKTGGSFPSKN